MNDADLDYHLEVRLDALRREFAGQANPEAITAVGRKHFEHLHRDATINDFIPELTHRFAREELMNAGHDQLLNAA